MPPSSEATEAQQHGHGDINLEPHGYYGGHPRRGQNGDQVPLGGA
jgi:hypothetical protein